MEELHQLMLIEELVALLLGTDPGRFDAAVAQAKNRVTTEAKEAKDRERLTAFDQQVKTLCALGYPEAAGMEENQFPGYVNLLRDKFEIGDLIVIPERIVSIPKQMSMVKLNGKIGYIHLNLGALRQANGVETPNVPYLIRDVENGAAMRNTSPDKCVKQFKKHGRLGLTTEEGIAIATHKPETFNNLDCSDLPGSRYGSSFVPCLWFEYGRLMLGYVLVDSVSSMRGSASCGKRIRA